MTQYLVTGTDYTDEYALERRMSARESHLEGARRMKESGALLFAAALVNDDGKMAGSTMAVQFEDRTGLEQWLETEPYILAKVWETVEVKVIKLPAL